MNPTYHARPDSFKILKFRKQAPRPFPRPDPEGGGGWGRGSNLLISLVWHARTALVRRRLPLHINVLASVQVRGWRAIDRDRLGLGKRGLPLLYEGGQLRG